MSSEMPEAPVNAADVPDEAAQDVAPEEAATSGGAEANESGAEESNGDRLLIVTPEGMAVAKADGSPVSQIAEPDKVMRIGSMVKQLLEEVRNAPLDEAARARLAEVHEKSVAELKAVLEPDLAEELSNMTLPFEEGVTPTDAELRIAQAQLVGWLEGLFHGIQSMLFAQQMMARAQIEQMRRALPGGAMPSEAGDEGPGGPAGGIPGGSGSGLYL